VWQGFINVSVYFQHIQHIWVFFHRFAYFISIFIRVFSFVHISDKFACYSQDYHHSFVFACFLEAYIHIWIALLSWFYLVLVLVPQGPQKGETIGVRILRVFEQNTSDVRICFTTNIFLQVLSCQINSTHHTPSRGRS